MKIIGIVFARLDSARFPSKAMHPFLGTSLVLHVLTRASQVKGLDEVVLATSERSVDSPLAEMAVQAGFKVFRGEIDDVGGRALACANYFDAQSFVRLNGDSPIIDMKLLDLGCQIMRESKVDFITNLYPTRTYPYGISVEIIRTDFYSSICSNFRTEEECEHLSLPIYNNIGDVNYTSLPACSHPSPSFKMTVDFMNDIKGLEQIYYKIVKSDGSIDYSALPLLIDDAIERV